jgi:hypothetical protein
VYLDLRRRASVTVPEVERFDDGLFGMAHLLSKGDRRKIARLLPP